MLNFFWKAFENYVHYLTRTAAQAEEEARCSRQETKWLTAAGLGTELVSKLADGGYKRRIDLLRLDAQTMFAFHLLPLDQSRLEDIVVAYSNWKEVFGKVCSKVSYDQMKDLIDAMKKQEKIDAEKEKKQREFEERYETYMAPLCIEDVSR